MSVHRFGATPWQAPTAPGADPAMVAAAQRLGVDKKHLVQGEAGFFAQIVRFPPGFTAPVHSHDHAEVFVVLDGGCVFDGEPLGRWDVSVVEANRPYGFTAGPDGVQFLVVRTGEAAATVSR